MYLDTFEIVSYGSKWVGNKEKKNQVVAHLVNEDGIQLKDIVQLAESYEDTIHRHRGGKIRVLIEILQDQE
tara:strand:- start:731 stop:943 length:213 start_codon:yes stop_codon:yes gene_type:complete